MRHFIAGTVIALVLVSAGCGGGSTTSTSTPAAAPATETTSPAVPAKSGPDEAAKTAFVNALNAIDPAIVDGKPDRAVDRGRNQCTSVEQWPDDRAKLVSLTEQRFTSKDKPNGFGPDVSGKILDAVRTHLCP